jgi:carbamoyl-phosphate synthase small subunit
MLKGPIYQNKKVKENRSQRGDFFKSKSGRLTLADGRVFKGEIPGWQKGDVIGEVVFNTGMTGYVESLTDPSYAGQILVFTYPLIGNYGVQLDSTESGKVQVTGVVVSEAAEHFSHAGTDFSLLQWLKYQNIPVLMGADTRALTKHLRTEGTMVGAISDKTLNLKGRRAEKKFVSINKATTYNPEKTKKIILVDCGSKENIVREITKLPLQVKRVPFDYDYSEEEYDGVLLSNGPGDPTDYNVTIGIAKKALQNGKPMFGICLGSQIMGLAAGAKTYKLKFGHRGHNQPCIDTKTNHGYITSQNHGYAIEEKSLPKDWQVTFRNLNDGSIEGIAHKSKPFFSVQFHPEACPGPTDTEWLFESFYNKL